jgi:sterol desaturase/sphingolipid hydroxylase (fatty acid hydroxylase superfamily)
VRIINVADQQRSRSVWVELVRFGFPGLMLVGVNGIAWWLAAEGAPKVAVVGVLVAAVGLSFAAERVLPYAPEWNRSLGDSGRDVAHAVVNESLQIVSLLALPLLVGLLSIEGVWPGGLPFAVQVIGSILLVDFGITIGHWLSHRWEVLWRCHAVHHSVKRFYGFNGLMKHPAHQLFETMIATAPLIVLGLPTDVATAVVVAVSVQLLLQHSNVDYALGPLRGVLALNHVHRFHHLRWAGIGDVNFGLFTTLWDRMLGTAVWDPARRFTSDDIGIGAEPDFPVTYGAQLVKPFQPTQTTASHQVVW